MPVILLYVSDASGENWRIVNVPPPWSSSTGTTGGGTTLCFNTVTTATTASSVLWPDTSSTMATTAFDTSTFCYQDQLAQQAMRQLHAAQYQSAVQQLNASPGAINNISRQQLQQQLGQLHQQAQLDQRLCEDRDGARRAAANREAARNRARDLLLDHLTEAQRETIRQHGWFVVEGGRSRTPYRIHINRGPAGNIDELDGHGLVRARLCGHIRHTWVPDYDEFLAQMLMLQAEEDEYLRIANRRRVYG